MTSILKSIENLKTENKKRIEDKPMIQEEDEIKETKKNQKM